MDITILADRLFIVRFQADTIIGRVDVAIGHFKIVAVDDIHAVVVPVRLAVDYKLPDDYVLALVVLLIPAGRVLQGYALDPNVPAAPEVNVLWPDALARAVISQRVFYQPFVNQVHQIVRHNETLSVDHTPFTGYSDVFLLEGKD